MRSEKAVRSDMKERNDGYLPCPWCGELPNSVQHYRNEDWSCVHNCKVVGTVISLTWAAYETQVTRWNSRFNANAQNAVIASVPPIRGRKKATKSPPAQVPADPLSLALESDGEIAVDPLSELM